MSASAVDPNPVSPRMASAAAAFDPFQRFIRVVNVQERGMVEFEFALGEPEMFVEMIMPMPVFEEFCHAQGQNPQMCLAAARPAGHQHLSFLR